jgi:hypothetical protein
MAKIYYINTTIIINIIWIIWILFSGHKCDYIAALRKIAES